MGPVRALGIVLVALLLPLDALALEQHKKVTLQLQWDHQFQFAGYYAALWKGYYTEEGLQVTVRSAFEPNGKFHKSTKEVAQRRADFGVGAIDILKARDAGIPLVILATVFQHSPVAFYARSEAGLQSPADLTRLRVATRGKAGRAYAELMAMLRAENISPSRIRTQPIREKLGLRDLAGGHADVAAGFTISAGWLAKELGLKLTALHPASYGVDFYGGALFTHRELLDDHPEIADAFVRASLKGWQYALANPEKIARRIARELPRHIPLKDAEGFNRFQIDPVAKLIQQKVITLGHTNRARWHRMHTALKNAGLVKNAFDAKTAIYDPHQHSRNRLRNSFRFTISLLLMALAAGLAIWIYPLHRNIRLRKIAAQELHKQSALLKDTVETMAQGVVVFDADHRLVAFNTRYEEIFELPPDFLKPGMPMSEIVRNRAERGLYGEGDVEEHVKMRVKRAKIRMERSQERILSTGRVYLFHRKPMEDGGFVTTFTDITERKRIESALRNSEERFRRAFENSGVGMTIRNEPDGTLITNAAFQKMLGYTQEELQTLHSRDLTHPEDRHQNKRSRRKILDGEVDNVQVTKRYMRKNGETVWLINEMSAVRDADGQLTYTINLFQDITERKLAEREAAEKSALLETTIDTLGNGVMVFDKDMRLVRYNDPAAKLLSLPKEVLRPGTSFKKIVRYRAERGDYGDGDLEEIVKGQSERAKSNPERIRERTILDGTTYIHHRKPMPGGGCVISYSDITERKLAEQEAAQTSRLLEATFENMAQGVVVFDSDLKLVAFNPQYTEITGLSAEAIHLGLTREEFVRHCAETGWFGNTDVEKYVAGRIESVERGEISHAERITPDGRKFLYERTPMPDGGYISTVTDITERHEAEKKLQQAQKMEAVGQLTGGIAHDFNNLLAVSMGNVELAEEVAQSGGDVLPFLATVKRASERGASLTNQLLAFSRKQTLFPQVTDAAELVGGMAELLRSSLGETIAIKVTGDDGIWPCEVDPHQLESAILNLAINARDAMPSGGTLAIGASNVCLDDDYAAAQTEVEPGDYVMVAVSDTGTGMPQDVIDQVFDPFFTTKGVGRGSGLGLSMVYGFAKQSGGHVTIYSEEREGTAVKLYLPRSDKAQGHLGQGDQEGVLKARGETVLVVEDDRDVRTLSVALLRSFGYEVLEAADGESALKLLETAPPVNLLFSDVVLPGGMSGPELAAEVRGRYPGIAVLYTSGYTDLVGTDQSAFGEDTELLQKPYRKADLARMVRQALDQARS
jgi:PAS domain S-box-containing protein